MSSRCQCLFSGPADTMLGCHRDPISSEKCWLDYAVRELSRVAAGKAKGQEAVWRIQCKPEWWDNECQYSWKNPTANPKDSKDTLKTKFECLVRHLRNCGQLPSEMEEEVCLWEQGKVSQVFLMTAFSSMLGQASNLHSVLEDTCRKMKDTGLSVAPSILTDLQSCLFACVETIKNNVPLGHSGSTTPKAAGCSGLKRVHCETDSDTFSQQPTKRRKTSSSDTSCSLSSASSCLSPSQTPQTSFTDPDTRLNPQQQKMLLEVLKKKITQKRATQSGAPVPPSSGCSVQARTRPLVAHSKLLVLEEKSAAAFRASVPNCQSAIATEPECHAAPERICETDFLELDLVGTEDVDLDFWNHMLEEKSSVTVKNSVDNAPTSVPALSTVLSEKFPLACPSVENDTLEFSTTHPLLSHTTIRACENDSFKYDSSEDRQDGIKMVSTEEESCPTLFLDAGDTFLHETDVVCESGYNSENSASTPVTSIRGSVDSDTDSFSYSDLNSPDLEAYLDSLDC